MTPFKRTAFSLASAAGMLLAGNAYGQSWLLVGNAINSTDFLGTTNAQDFRLRANNVEHMRVSTTGKVGIGTTTPQTHLHINTNPSEPQLLLDDGAASWELWAGNDLNISRTGINWLYFGRGFNKLSNSFDIGPASEIHWDGVNDRIGIGTTSPNAKLTVAGDITPSSNCTFDIGSSVNKWNIIYACNGTIQTSDAHLKQNIHDLSYGLNDLMKLRPVSFTWANDPAYGTKLGLIAQEVQQVVGEVVKTGEDGSMGIFYSDLIPVLIKSIQQQQGTLADEESENRTLHEQLAAQTARIAQLEAALRTGTRQNDSDTAK